MTGKAANGHFDTHVCLVSQQATPNLTPVLDPEFGPARLVMLVTPEMSQRAQWLESVLRSRTHVKVERIEVTDAWDMHGVLEQLIQWIDQQAPDASIALNVTGAPNRWRWPRNRPSRWQGWPSSMCTRRATRCSGWNLDCRPSR